MGLSDEEGSRISGAPKILAALSSVLIKAITKNEKMIKTSSSKKKETISIFHGSRAPVLGIQQYIERIYKYSDCSPSCFVVAYIYMDRFLCQKKDFYLTSLNAHRLLITSFMLAAKYLEDECYRNGYYAKVGGISTEELNKLEMEFLFSVDFKLHVTVETFDRYCLQLEDEAKVKGEIVRPIKICGLKKPSTNYASYTCTAI